MFRNRQQAGMALARQVTAGLAEGGEIDANQVVVLALPRGGVPVAFEIAQLGRYPLDVLVSKKVGAPGQPELAIGAVTSDGVTVINDKMTIYLGISDAYVETQKQLLMRRTTASEQHWRRAAAMKGPIPLAGKQVVVVDDGIATGMTAIAAVRSVRQRQPNRVIVATPVMSCSAYALLAEECDRIFALTVPFDFAAIGQFYEDFHQVTDEEVVSALRAAHNRDTIATDMAIS
jgi:predicted phosphoribosyltransferase